MKNAAVEKLLRIARKLLLFSAALLFPPFGVCAWMETVDPVDYPAAIAIGPSRGGNPRGACMTEGDV